MMWCTRYWLLTVMWIMLCGRGIGYLQWCRNDVWTRYWLLTVMSTMMCGRGNGYLQWCQSWYVEEAMVTYRDASHDVWTRQWLLTVIPVMMCGRVIGHLQWCQSWCVDEATVTYSDANLWSVDTTLAACSRTSGLLLKFILLTCSVTSLLEP